MPSSYQRIFEYYEVGDGELMLTEIIPYKIPVLYRGSIVNTNKWMNFNSWHEIYSHLDEIMHDYSQKSISREIQYVKGVSVIIGYQFESADPHVQMFPLLSRGKSVSSGDKEDVIEFKMCSLKLVASIYPVQINCPEIELPYFFVRNYEILIRFLEKEVKNRICVSKLNRERRKRLTKSEGVQTSPQSKWDKYDTRNNKRESLISKLNIFDFNSESTLSPTYISSSPASGNRDFDGKVKKKNSFKKAFEDNYNNNVKSKNSDCLKRKNNYSQDDFKIGRSKKKKKSCNSKKEKKETSSSIKRNKSENKRESGKKHISEEVKCKNHESERKIKITRFVCSSLSSIFDDDTSDDNFSSFNSLTPKAGNEVTSNPLKEIKNKLKHKRHFKKVIHEDSKDERLDNVKKREDIGTNLCDTLPDLLNGYEKEYQGNDIENTINSAEVKDGILGNANSFNNGVDSCDILPDLNVFNEHSQGNEINNIRVDLNEKILDESQLSTSRSKSVELFSLNETTSSLLVPLEPEGETLVGKQTSSEVKGGKLGNANSFNNGVNSCDILPDLNVFNENSQGNEINNIRVDFNEKILDESHLSTSRSKSVELFSLNETTSSLLVPLESEGETLVGKQSSSNESKLFEVSANILNLSSNNFTDDDWTDSLPDLTQSITTKTLNKSSLTLGSTEILHCFAKTKDKTITSNAYVKGSKNQSTMENKNITSKSKNKNNTKDKKPSKKRTFNKRRQKSSIDSPNISSSSHSSSIGVSSFYRNKCTANNSTSSSNKNEESFAVSDNTISDKHKVEDNLEDHSSADNCEDNLVKRVYNDLRKLTIEDFEYHLEKHKPYLENIVLGKIPNDRDKKMFRGCDLGAISSELFVHILDESIVDGLMNMCQANFSTVMNSSGRNIKEVLYNMLVIIPELLKMVLLSLPCAKENNVTETDCEQIFLLLSTYIDEGDENEQY